MIEQKTLQNSYPPSHELIRAAGEAIVKNSQRRVKIEGIIQRDGNLPALFVVRYLDIVWTDQYLFYKEELVFSQNAVQEHRRRA